jgi:hypothetical protein
VFACNPEGLSEVPDGVSFTKHPPHVLEVGSLGSAEVLVAMKTRYPAFAPDTADQLNVTGSATLVAPFDGLDSVGADNCVAAAFTVIETP